MPRRSLAAVSALLLAIGTCLSAWAASPACAQGRAPTERMVVIRDAETEALLHTFANPLFRAAGLNPSLVRIILVRDRAINAFVTTGNRMFINTGLLQQAGSALEVVGVIAHETGHVQHGDVTRMPEAAREALLQSLATMLIAAAAGVGARSPDVGMGAMLGGTSMVQRKFLAFTRGQEEGADQAGLRYLEQLGWSAAGMETMFARLERQEALLSDRQDPYLITHPLTQDRIDFVRHQLAASRFKDTPLPAGFESGFQLVKAKLDGFLLMPEAVLRKYPPEDGSPPVRYARAVGLHRMGHSAEAIALLDGLIAQAPSDPWFQELKGQMLFEAGRGLPAVAAYRQAVRLAPDQPLIRQSLAQAMIESGDTSLLRGAVEQLQMAQRDERDDDTTWHLLGIAWGRLGNIGEANLALAEEAMLADDIQAARRFARLAAEALPPGPSRLRALDISNAVKKENRS